MEIEIQHSLDIAMEGIEDFFEREIPFVMSQALNDTAFDARKRIVGSTYPKAFRVKNKRFAGRTFRVLKKADKYDLHSMIGDDLGRDYLMRHITGGIKTPKGSTSLAIPRQPGLLRGVSGQILKRNKPRRITDKKDTFLISRGSKKIGIFKRVGKGKGGLQKMYGFHKEARIDRKFRFYRDAEDTALRVFPGHFFTRMKRVAARSMVFSGE
jgi:hypothetical protein